ncbi:hypothetical protein [Skermania piniformis]|uniref:DUF4403 family protein n=1 Tax=Skermania pinensis TaxID=39122 RepID=A0ABX8S7W6_9ACTN|nr:hypothetical protein [Skermania piniformis]QXQ13097.1 hypothetical protein KV203_14525 [Skermania piniformis]
MIEFRTGRRALLIALSVLVGVVTCVGSSAAAGGGRTAPAPSLPAAQPDFLPAPTALRLFADRIRLIKPTALVTGSPIALANGTMSPPDTIYLKVSRIELDNLSITVPSGGTTITIANQGAGADAAAAGSGPDAVVDLWIQIHALQLCVTPQLFQQLAIGYAGVFGGALDQVLQMIDDAFAPAVAGPLATVGPCVPAAPLLPLVGVFLANGVPLPDGKLEAGAADISVWAVKVRNSAGVGSFILPRSLLQVGS